MRALVLPLTLSVTAACAPGWQQRWGDGRAGPDGVFLGPTTVSLAQADCRADAWLYDVSTAGPATGGEVTSHLWYPTFQEPHRLAIAEESDGDAWTRLSATVPIVDATSPPETPPPQSRQPCDFTWMTFRVVVDDDLGPSDCVVFGYDTDVFPEALDDETPCRVLTLP